MALIKTSIIIDHRNGNDKKIIVKSDFRSFRSKIKIIAFPRDVQKNPKLKTIHGLLFTTQNGMSLSFQCSICPEISETGEMIYYNGHQKVVTILPYQ